MKNYLDLIASLLTFKVIFHSECSDLKGKQVKKRQTIPSLRWMANEMEPAAEIIASCHTIYISF